MPRYQLDVQVIITSTLEIIAENEQEAEAQAKRQAFAAIKLDHHFGRGSPNEFPLPTRDIDILHIEEIKHN